jgi:hypothetical protein
MNEVNVPEHRYPTLFLKVCAIGHGRCQIYQSSNFGRQVTIVSYACPNYHEVLSLGPSSVSPVERIIVVYTSHLITLGLDGVTIIGEESCLISTDSVSKNARSRQSHSSMVCIATECSMTQKDLNSVARKQITRTCVETRAIVELVHASPPLPFMTAIETYKV